MILSLALVAFLILVSFLVQRTFIGQRFKGKYPTWVLRVAKSRPPVYFRTGFSQKVTWLLRRFYPALVGLTGFKVMGILSGNPVSSIPLSTTTWITLSAGATAIWTAGWVFAPYKRNGPLSLWSAWIGAILAIAGGLIFQISIIGYEVGLFGIVDWLPLTASLSDWSIKHSIEDSIGFTLTVVGLGVAVLALQESAPDIGDPSTTPSDLLIALPRAPIDSRASDEPKHKTTTYSSSRPIRRKKQNKRKKRANRRH